MKRPIRLNRLKTRTRVAAFLLSILCWGLSGCVSTDLATANKPDYSTFGQMAVLPFAGTQGVAMATHVSSELKARGASVATLEALSSEQETPGRERFDEKTQDLLTGRSLEGIDHLVTGSLITRKIFYARGESKNEVLRAELDIISAETGKVVARADYSSEARTYTPQTNVHSENFLARDMAARLVVRIRQVHSTGEDR
jgi:hypothetical protein